MEKECRTLLRSKGIDWGKVRREFLKEAKRARSLDDHYTILVRLVARLRDGHAYVEPLEGAKNAKGPWPDLDKGAGLFLCMNGDRILVKNAWADAEREGVAAGMEILKIDGAPAGKWLASRLEGLQDVMGFSTEQQARYFALHWGLGGPAGSKLDLALEDTKGRKRSATVRRGEASTVPYGPAFPPPDLKTVGRQSYGRTPGGFGYVHLRDVPDDLPSQLDTMLAELGRVPGLVLDCRANGGGGTDHDAVFGRFVPQGKALGRYASAGPNPYGGPVVVIVDAGVRSAGETVSGMLKEDGRAYMIGDSPTAGMSSQKAMIDLPSGLFRMRVSTDSNKARFQGGRGIEGVGVEPHAIVPYEAADLAEGVDTLVRRAEGLLRDFPEKDVSYKPDRYGWRSD